MFHSRWAEKRSTTSHSCRQLGNNFTWLLICMKLKQRFPTLPHPRPHPFFLNSNGPQMDIMRFVSPNLDQTALFKIPALLYRTTVTFEYFLMSVTYVLVTKNHSLHLLTSVVVWCDLMQSRTAGFIHLEWFCVCIQKHQVFHVHLEDLKATSGGLHIRAKLSLSVGSPSQTVKRN